MGILRFGGYELESRQECALVLPAGGVENLEFAALAEDRYVLEVWRAPARGGGVGLRVTPQRDPLALALVDPARSVVSRVGQVGEVHAVNFRCRVTGNHLLLLDGSRLSDAVRLRVALERHVAAGEP